MRDYELLYIVSGSAPEPDATKVADEVGALIGKQGGTLAGEDEFQGRRKLAYPIGKDGHGWYVVTRFAIDPAKVTEVQRALNLKGSIVRSLIVAASEVPTAEEKAKLEAAGERKSEKDEDKKPVAKAAVPETVAKAAPAKTEPAEAEAEAKPKKQETAAEKKERQSQLEAALSEKLSEE